MSSPPALRQRLKTIIVESCGLTHVTAAEVTDDEILFGPQTRVQLNSLDAVEIAMNIQIEFGVKLENSSSAREYFKCVGSLADHVASKMEPQRLAGFQ